MSNMQPNVYYRVLLLPRAISRSPVREGLKENHQQEGQGMHTAEQPEL